MCTKVELSANSCPDRPVSQSRTREGTKARGEAEEVTAFAVVAVVKFDP